jgi:transposase-like protein
MRVPHSVRSVAEAIGLDAAVRLMRASYKSPHTDGGGKVYVPASDIPPGHRLHEVLTADELTALRRTFGGELLPYPSSRGVKRRIAAERRARAILLDIQAGVSSSEIAAKHGVSSQYVRRIRSKGTTSSGWRGKREG